MNQIQETGYGEKYDRPRVLLMEDETSLAKGLAMVMREEGYHVDLADTGRGALEQFQKSDFDLLVADLRLPDINGMEVVEQVKGQKPKTNVVIITGYPTVASAVQAVKMGVSDYLRKPFTEDEFMTAVKSSLRERKRAAMGALLVLSWLYIAAPYWSAVFPLKVTFVKVRLLCQLPIPPPTTAWLPEKVTFVRRGLLL